MIALAWLALGFAGAGMQWATDDVGRWRDLLWVLAGPFAIVVAFRATGGAKSTRSVQRQHDHDCGK